MQRVAVVGSGGSGKSTLADSLGELTGLPVTHLDRLYWQPGWVATDDDRWRQLQAGLVAGERWIVDGNYGSTLDVRLARAEVVIVLGTSRWRCLQRVAGRWWRHRGRDVQAAGCTDRLTIEFVRYIWRWPAQSRPRLDAAIARHREHLQVVELTASRQVQAYLASLADGSSGTVRNRSARPSTRIPRHDPEVVAAQAPLGGTRSRLDRR